MFDEGGYVLASPPASLPSPRRDRFTRNYRVNACLRAFFLLLRAAHSNRARKLSADSNRQRTRFGKIVNPERRFISLREHVLLESFSRSLPMRCCLRLQDCGFRKRRAAPFHGMEVDQHARYVDYRNCHEDIVLFGIGQAGINHLTRGRGTHLFAIDRNRLAIRRRTRNAGAK